MMLPWERLRDKIITLEGKPYASYQSLQGAYRFDRFVFHLDAVVPDHQQTSSMRVRVDQAEARFPAPLWSSSARRIALEDYVARRWAESIRKVLRNPRGGRGAFVIDGGGQQILERTACRIADDYVEIRGGIVLPGDGRKAAPKIAQAMVFEDLPQLVEAALLFSAHDPAVAQRHADVAEDADALRAQLSERGLVAFLADGAILPREPGTDRPVLSRLVTLQSPPELQVTMTLPHRGPLAGMGIPRGVTVITGPVFSGRSTLLRAIAAGVYTHLPGDGREYCATVADAALVRSDNGRRVEGVNLTPFVVMLPGGDDPRHYRTEHAAGVISQAAGLSEALEVGCSLLLIDEDTSAAGLLARDTLWRRLAPDAAAPVTPLAELVRPLYEEHGISTVVVTGAGADYAAVADTIIAMEAFRPRAVTAQARSLATGAPPAAEGRGRFGGLPHRVPLPDSVNFLRGRRLRSEAEDPGMVQLGRDAIDLSRLEQMVDPGQARAIGAALVFAADQSYVDGTRTLREILALLDTEISQRGLDVLSPPDAPVGDHARPRRQEMAAAFNRMKTLRVKS